MTKFLATYEHHYHCDGYQSSDEFIVADTLEELRVEMANTHYGASFPYFRQDGDCEIHPTMTTSNWKIYHFQEDIDINSLPEFQKQLNERKRRFDEKIAAQEAQKVIDAEKRKAARYQKFLEMKAEFEGEEQQEPT